MNAKQYIVAVTTDASGDATVYTSKPVNGRIFTVKYSKTDFADGVDFTITTETTGQNVWVQENVNASALVCPRQPTHDYAGNASLYASGGEPVEDYIIAANERIKIVIAAGGDTKSGTFEIIAG